MMQNFSWVLFLLVCFTACQSRDYNPDQLTHEEISNSLYSMSRYYGKLPKKHADHENKFEVRFDEYYKLNAKEHQLKAYYKANNGKEYFLLKKVAPSRFEKFFATGIEVEKNESGEITYYKEVFRTWRFAEPEFTSKSMKLFDKMVQGEDLSPYYSQNSGKEEFIEFPDLLNAFDTKTRRWLHPSLVAKK